MFDAHAPNIASCALLMATLAGCGGGGGSDLPRAKAPGLPDEDARCRAAALRETPLVTEWSAPEKANLQARLREGALAVEYTGCNMRPIPACVLRGSYRWRRTTISTDVIEVQNRDELFAKLSLGAVALEGELARSGRIAVQTTVSGQFMLDGSSAADVPDYGECAQATHLLTGLSIGSFKLRSGGTLQAEASIGFQQQNAGAKTSSAETVLREAGDFESCKLATDEAADIGCSSPIQAFLTPLPRFARERGEGTVKVTFASGSANYNWELRKNREFLCRTPCTRWVNPTDPYQLQSEAGLVPETLDVPDLRPHAGEAIEVRATPTDSGTRALGIVTTALGGGAIFFGGFFALLGSAGDRDGFVVGGGITAAVGAVAIAPGVWMIATSGATAEVVTAGPDFLAPRGLAVRSTF